MRDFIDFIDRFKIIQNLERYYLGDKINLNNIEILNNLRLFFSNNDIKIIKNLDLIAFFYQNYVEHIQRKPLGEFYTPVHIVNRILNGIGYNLNSHINTKSIIDISCGSGSFLIQAIRKLLIFELNRLRVENLNDLSIKDAINIVNNIYSLIYGIDINPIACILCQINIIFTLFDVFQKILKTKPDYQIPLFQISNQNALEIYFDQEYDFVVGNPPYIFIRNISKDQKKLIERRNFTTNKGQYDYYQLFLEIGIRSLKRGGFLGFIIPDSILALSNRSVLRKFIYETTFIKEISVLGPQFEDPTVANIILILEKNDDIKKRENNLININFEVGKEHNSNKITQNMIKTWDYNFLINLNPTDMKIITYLKNSFPNLETLLKDKRYEIIISRGVELTKKGQVIYCDTCKKYLPLPKSKLICLKCGRDLNKSNIDNIVINKVPSNSQDKFAPFLSTINRYKANRKQFINISKPGINYKNPEIYQKRIIIRQLNEKNLICATYDDLSYTSQSFYNLKIIKSPIAQFNNYYLLGLLNSELLSYYFIKSFGSYKILFPRILIEKIKSLPIKIPSINSETKIAVKIQEEVLNLLNFNQKDLKKGENSELLLNKLIYDLYRVDLGTREYISSFLKNL